MRQRHAEIINSKPPCVEPPLQLVQSTGQWGGPTPKSGGRMLDGRTSDEMLDTTTVLT
jgi:protein gp37